MLFNLAGQKSLINANNEDVQQQIKQNGFYLQMPKQQEIYLNKKDSILSTQ